MIARGLINGVGIATDNRRQVPPGRPFQSTLIFPEGDLSGTIAPRRPHISFDPSTCVVQVSQTEKIVVTGGTRKFAAAKGTARSTVHVTEIVGHRSDGSCLGPDTAPVFELVIVRDTARISLT